MQPKILTTAEHFNNLMAMRVFTEACEQWCVENKNFKYEIKVKTTYFDMSQDWKYTAFITIDTDTDESWQSLCPRDWELVVEEFDINRIVEMAWFYMDNLQKPYKERKSLYEKF